GGDTPHDVRKGVSRDVPPFLSPPEAMAEVRASRRGLFANEVSGASTVSGEDQRKEAWLQTSSPTSQRRQAMGKMLSVTSSGPSRDELVAIGPQSRTSSSSRGENVSICYNPYVLRERWGGQQDDPLSSHLLHSTNTQPAKGQLRNVPLKPVHVQEENEQTIHFRQHRRNVPERYKSLNTSPMTQPLSPRELYTYNPALNNKRGTAHISGRAARNSPQPNSMKNAHAPAQARKFQPISSAGVALLWPLLPGLFRKLGLLEGNCFIDDKSQRLASGCLDWLTRIEEIPVESKTVSGLLCGLSEDNSVFDFIMPEQDLRIKIIDWLAGLLEILPAAWKKISVGDMRQWFLIRSGWLADNGSNITLFIKPDIFDFLLNDWPWPTDLIVLPWLQQPIYLRWEEP
uniref:contractile injection system tape measure protein n=1 Tax=Aeromonas jandaei TaxID=650 RepID=UPI003B9F4276